MIPMSIAVTMLMGSMGATADNSDAWDPMPSVPRRPDTRPVAPPPVMDDERRMAAAVAKRERRSRRRLADALRSGATACATFDLDTEPTP